MSKFSKAGVVVVPSKFVELFEFERLLMAEQGLLAEARLWGGRRKGVEICYMHDQCTWKTR